MMNIFLRVTNRKGSFKTLPVICSILAAFLLLPGSSISQQVRPQDSVPHLPNGTDGLTFLPRKADSTFLVVRNDLPFNEFTGIYSTFKIGVGYIGDATTYVQDDVFKQQMDSLGISLGPRFVTRDFRAIFSGRLLKSKRFISYRFAYMYDGDQKKWLMRETGVTVGVPELKGHFFIGRTKEGFSMIKVMNGHSGIANERQMALDPIPILADGIKYFGYFPKSKLFMNLGYFNDFMSKGQSFSSLRWQYVTRAGWVPINDKKNNTVLHLAGNFSYGKPNNAKFTVKSRPESNPTPHLINTGEFPADYSTSVGGEIFYSKNRFTIGTEVIQHNFTSDKAGPHHFKGGDVIVAFFLTKGRRPYNSNIGNIFEFAGGGKSIFEGGLGAIELVFHASTFNLNDGSIKGGQFTRFTPMINWYLSKTIRWELIYGYGILDRFNMKGKVQFFESRIQFSFL